MNRRFKEVCTAALGVVLFSAVTAVAVVLCFIFIDFEEEPSDAFKRHFGDTIPASVVDISVSGHTGLAGSDEILTFTINEEELNGLLRLRAFVDVSKQVANGWSTGISPALWTANVAMAKDIGISASRCFEITRLNGLVYYILIFDAVSGRVFYHYFKT